MRITLTCSLLIALLPPGCAAPQEETAAWSSKDDSVPGRAPRPTSLHVDAPDVDPGLAENLRPTAIDVLMQAIDSTDPLLRANAIEGLHHAPEHLEPAVRVGLADDNRGVRFVAAMTVGTREMADLVLLVKPLREDPSDSVRAAALFALHRNGHDVDLNALADMIRSADPEVKANAALVLGELGDRSAIPLLQRAMATGLERASIARARLVDMQIAEALVKLGEIRELEGIRANLFAPPEQGELTALACLISARLEDQRVVNNLADLASRTGSRQQSPEVRMAAVMALTDLSPERAPLDVPLQFATSDRFDLRAQAAITLGAFRRAAGLPTLARLLNDEHPLVQVAAAAAIVRVTGVSDNRLAGR